MNYLKEVRKLQVGVVATPDIHSFDLTERDNFIILGCDGLWGVPLLLTLFCVLNLSMFIRDLLRWSIFSKFNTELVRLCVFQVFGPGDAVEFVHKLLKVSTHFSHSIYVYIYRPKRHEFSPRSEIIP